MFKKHILPILLLAGTVAVFGCSNNSSPEKPGTENNAETQQTETTEEDSFSFSVDFPTSVSVKGLISYDAAKRAFVAKDGYTSYRWCLNERDLSNTKGFLLLTDSLLSACDVQPGKYYPVMVIATDVSGIPYSDTLEFKLEKID